MLHSTRTCKQQEAYPDSLGRYTAPLTPDTKVILGATSSTVSGSPGFPANGFGTWHLSTELIPNGYKNPLLFVALHPQMSPKHSSTVTERILYECKCIDCLPSQILVATNLDSKLACQETFAGKLTSIVTVRRRVCGKYLHRQSPPDCNDFTDTVAIVEFALTAPLFVG